MSSRIGATLPTLKGESTIPFRGHDLTDPDWDKSCQPSVHPKIFLKGRGKWGLRKKTLTKWKGRSEEI